MARLERSSVTIATTNGKKSVEALIDPDISGLALTKTTTRSRSCDSWAKLPGSGDSRGTYLGPSS